jgi:hypothetical protein
MAKPRNVIIPKKEPIFRLNVETNSEVVIGYTVLLNGRQKSFFFNQPMSKAKWEGKE